MKTDSFIEFISKEAQQEIISLRKQKKELSAKIHLLESSNEILNSRLHTLENRKLVKVLLKYYSAVDKYPVFKLFARIIYYLLYIPFKVLIGFKRAKTKDSSEDRAILKEITDIIINSQSKEIIFFIAPVLWDIPLYQRPQHIALNMSKLGIPYFYVIKWQEDRKVRKLAKNCYEVSAMGLDFAFILEIIKLIGKKKKIFVKTYSTELEDISEFLDEVRKLGGNVLYEYVDEIDSSIAGKTIPDHVIKRFEDTARDERNSYVVSTATKLFEDVSFYRKNRLVLATNGVDFAHFDQKFNKSNLPFQLLKIFREGKPLIGYYGAFASWMDYDLLKHMAKERPDYNFVLIGVDYDGSIISSGISEYKNIIVLPPVDYHDLPRYAFFLDVCMIPFKVNDVTKSTSPIKLFEYMALHKPIVTTAMPECKKYKSVMIANSNEEFVKCLDNAIKLRGDKGYVKLLEKEALENTWESKAKEIIKLIRS